jgi:hypothetical protein
VDNWTGDVPFETDRHDALEWVPLRHVIEGGVTLWSTTNPIIRAELEKRIPDARRADV